MVIKILFVLYPQEAKPTASQVIWRHVRQMTQASRRVARTCEGVGNEGSLSNK